MLNILIRRKAVFFSRLLSLTTASNLRPFFRLILPQLLSLCHSGSLAWTSLYPLHVRTLFLPHSTLFVDVYRVSVSGRPTSPSYHSKYPYSSHYLRCCPPEMMDISLLRCSSDHPQLLHHVGWWFHLSVWTMYVKLSCVWMNLLSPHMTCARTRSCINAVYMLKHVCMYPCAEMLLLCLSTPFRYAVGIGMEKYASLLGAHCG